MKLNDAVKHALGNFIKMPRPGYAALIDAPWGAGKTHFIKRFISEEIDDESYRYISLNGVSNETSFRRAVIRESLAGASIEKFMPFGNGVLSYLKVRQAGDLIRDIAEEYLISNVPRVLVFDDLERATIDPQVLLGLLNDFVEHKGRNLIILANLENHPERDSLFDVIEKIVGKRLTINPDFIETYDSIIGLLDEGRGRAFFEENRALVERVFTESGYQNLRLVRNAVRDCAKMLNDVEEEYFLAKEPMERFVGTYLVFAMTLAKGDIKNEHLKKRNSFRVVDNSENNEEFAPLHNLFSKHKGLDINTLGGAVFTTSMGISIFEIGYIEPSVLNAEMKETGQFGAAEPDPLWKQLSDWMDKSLVDIEILVKQGRGYLFNNDKINPGHYLHIFHSVYWIKKNEGVESDLEILVQEIIARINELVKLGLLPAARFGTQLGWGLEGNRFSFGGYTWVADEECLRVLHAMRDAQIEMYQKSLKEVGKEIKSIFAVDMKKFLNKISYNDNDESFFSYEILHTLDVEEFSSEILKSLYNGKRADVANIIERIAERHRNGGEWQREKDWLVKLKETLIQQASQRSSIASAQLRQFLKWHWKFQCRDASSES